MPSSPLPEFDNPPVSEVALSVDFSPLENWKPAHPGLYWSSISSRYPNTEMKPPLPSQIEKFNEEFQQPQVRFEFNSSEHFRMWFVAEPANWLIQIQPDRFILNWKKVRGDEPYPRYSELRTRFVNEWRQFQNFLKSANIGLPVARQCEVTYVNDCLKGEGWNTIPDALGLLSFVSKGRQERYLPNFEELNLAGSFLMPDQQGRLHLMASHSRRAMDQKEVFQIRLLARGAPKSSSDDDIMNWMDVGREWIVRGFSDLTSPEAHALWGRRT